MRIVYSLPLCLALFSSVSWAEEKSAPSAKTDKPAAAKPAPQEETLDDLVGQAPEKAPEPAAKPAEKAAAADDTVTDDNDATPEAPPPTALAPVKAEIGMQRTVGPYELGPLDCRVLDGAGIERILPTALTAGEEPDLICRVLVTQPPNVVPATHHLSLHVFLGGRIVYQQKRNVRMSSLGRRSLVFVVPADRFTSFESTRVVIRATLSMPAKPATREVRFALETLD